MKASRNIIRKIGDVAMSVLLATLICVPIQATNALAEEAESNSIEQAAGEMSGIKGAQVSGRSDEMPVDESVSRANGANAGGTLGEAPKASDESTSFAMAAEPVEEQANNTTNSTEEVSKVEAFIAAFSASGTHTIELAVDITIDSAITIDAGNNLTIIGN